jgi:hypothetical protein
MSSLRDKSEKEIRAKRVSVTDDRVTVDLNDGRTISVPTKWYPRLLYGTAAERAKVEIWMDGIYWPRLNADISYRGLLMGNHSGESVKSFQRWLDYRERGLSEPILTLPMPAELSRFLKHEGSRKARKQKSRRVANHR